MSLSHLSNMWKLVQKKPRELVHSYAESYERYVRDWRVYEEVKARFNRSPNPHDFLFVSRTCYGGSIRFRKDGYLSTPIGPHRPISPQEFERRALEWPEQAVRNTEFVLGSHGYTVRAARKGDIVYCDPPYVDSQKIIYGAQEFTLARLFGDLEKLKKRGVFVALSIDGVKKSGKRPIDIEPPEGLFEEESFVALGGSMLKRFWRVGTHVRDEHVKDRLLLLHNIETDQLSLLPAFSASLPNPCITP